MTAGELRSKFIDIGHRQTAAALTGSRNVRIVVQAYRAAAALFEVAAFGTDAELEAYREWFLEQAKLDIADLSE